MAIVLDLQTAQHLETFQILTSIEQLIVTQALQQVTSPTVIDPNVDALAESIVGKTFTRQERIQYAKLNWLTRANPCLENITPIQALKAGQKERVLAEAAALGAN